jgi:hypothetical protein
LLVLANALEDQRKDPRRRPVPDFLTPTFRTFSVLLLSFKSSRLGLRKVQSCKSQMLGTSFIAHFHLARDHVKIPALAMLFNPENQERTSDPTRGASE